MCSDVLDVNDNVPFFTSSVYEASVAEGADVGTFVIKVSATDLDLGQNGEVSKCGPTSSVQWNNFCINND